MIFTIPLTLVYLLLLGLISVLPVSSGLPDIISSSFAYLWGFLWNLDFVVPVSTLISLLSLTLGFELAIFTWDAVHWILRKIPMLHIK